jgi:hypothetical protein
MNRIGCCAVMLGSRMPAALQDSAFAVATWLSRLKNPDVGQPQGKSIPFSDANGTALADIHRQGSSLCPLGFTEGQAEMPITTIKRARERDNEQG